MFKSLLLSIGFTAAISTISGILWVSHFWAVFSLVTLLQIVGYEIYRRNIENALILKAQEIKNQEAEIANRHMAVVECPCNDKNRQQIEIRQDKDILYKCDKCDKIIKAESVVKTVLTTAPIYFNNGNR